MKLILILLAFASTVAAQTKYSVNVQWDPNPAGDQVASYRLYYALQPTQPWPAGWSATNVPGSQATISLVPGRWSFIATASNDAGESLPSAQVTTSPPSTSPSGFTPIVTGPQSNAINVSWLANPPGEHVSSYSLWWAKQPSAGWPTNWNKLTVGGTNALISALQPGTYSLTLAGLNEWDAGPTNGTWNVTITAPLQSPSQVRGMKITIVQETQITP